jgi:hypothetical protein
LLITPPDTDTDTPDTDTPDMDTTDTDTDTPDTDTPGRPAAGDAALEGGAGHQRQARGVDVGVCVDVQVAGIDAHHVPQRADLGGVGWIGRKEPFLYYSNLPLPTFHVEYRPAMTKIPATTIVPITTTTGVAKTCSTQ